MTHFPNGACARRASSAAWSPKRAQPGDRVLDVGCGTGTLTILLKQMVPGAEVIGVDGDPDVLRIARRKATQAKASITWDHAMAYALPYADCSFSLVVSSLVIHYLTQGDKLRAFREVHRILRPGGEFHIADFGPAHGSGAWILSQLMRHLEETKDNFEGRLPEMLSAAEFAPVTTSSSVTTILGPVSLLHAARPL
jgi:ubiquinone/menaquinone biosynthesis C-methylase UbiE